MSQPREDVYRVAALLDALHRVLAPTPLPEHRAGPPQPVPPTAPPLPSDRRRSR